MPSCLVRFQLSRARITALSTRSCEPQRQRLAASASLILPGSAWGLGDQRRAGHHHAVGAVAALRRLLGDEGRLHRVRLLRRPQPFDGGDRLPRAAETGNRQERTARPSRRPYKPRIDRGRNRISDPSSRAHCEGHKASGWFGVVALDRALAAIHGEGVGRQSLVSTPVAARCCLDRSCLLSATRPFDLKNICLAAARVPVASPCSIAQCLCTARCVMTHDGHIIGARMDVGVHLPASILRPFERLRIEALIRRAPPRRPASGTRPDCRRRSPRH